MRVKCSICGDSFDGGPRAKRCKPCRDVYLRAYQRIFQRARVRGEELSAAEAHAYARQEARAAAKLRKSTSRDGRCLYCGRLLPPTRIGYCSACVKAGLHWLHAQTGRTNGWDRNSSNETTNPKEHHGLS